MCRLTESPHPFNNPPQIQRLILGLQFLILGGFRVVLGLIFRWNSQAGDGLCQKRGISRNSQDRAVVAVSNPEFPGWAGGCVLAAVIRSTLLAWEFRIRDSNVLLSACACRCAPRCLAWEFRIRDIISWPQPANRPLRSNSPHATLAWEFQILDG